MKILAIETSADETAAAVTEGRKFLSNVIYSQILTHAKWGGIYPALAKRAHEEKIDPVVNKALKKFNVEQDIDYIAVTQGPGLAIALEVGIKKAKDLAAKYNKKIIAVNHLEGHIYSCFVENSKPRNLELRSRSELTPIASGFTPRAFWLRGKGNPKREFQFPYLAFIISGGHTEIVLFSDHCTYQILGQTLDDAAGEALDKAAKILGLGYPGGPVIEQLAQQVDNEDFYQFPRPMLKSNNLDFSFSGLKTSFFYFLNTISEKERLKNLKQFASSYQEAVFETLEKKLESAIKKTGINRVVVGGGVSANQYLRAKLRILLKKHQGSVLFPPFKYLTGDNAVMIGVAAYYKAKKKMFVKDIDELDRIPRLRF